MRLEPCRRLLAGLMLAVAGPGVAASAADPKQLRYGEHLSQECSSCHRRDGVDNGIPSILGMKADHFVETLKYYQSGARTNAVMVSVARSLDEEQMRALAAYYESLPPPTRGKRR